MLVPENADGSRNTVGRIVAKSWQWLSSDYYRELGLAVESQAHNRSAAVYRETIVSRLPIEATNSRVFGQAPQTA
jgi:hypothetical protein